MILTQDDFKEKGRIQCPVCAKGMVIVYEGTLGHTSNVCPKCGHIILYDYESMTGIKIKPRRYQETAV